MTSTKSKILNFMMRIWMKFARSSGRTRALFRVTVKPDYFPGTVQLIPAMRHTRFTGIPGA